MWQENKDVSKTTLPNIEDKIKNEIEYITESFIEIKYQRNGEN